METCTVITLRDYQQTAVDAVLDAIDRRPVLAAPTGSGKTVMGVDIVRRHGGAVVWVAHRRELIHQAAAALRHLGIYPGLIMPGEPRTLADVQVGSVQTIARRGLPPCDLLVIDECHHVAAASYKVLEAPRILGLTATPFRLDGRGLRPPFETLVQASSVAELCRAGYLVEPEVYAPPPPDLSGIKVRGGDYAVEALGAAMSAPKLVGDVVRHWQKLTPGRRTVVFAVNVAHSKALVERFQGAGVAAEHLDADSTDRDQVLARLRTGQTHVVSNCMLLTEGWDLPALEVAVIARPTKSLCLHLQMIGRIMRACPDKAGAIVLDHAGNHAMHLRVTYPHEFTLDGVRREPRPAWHGLGRCPKCYMLLEPTWRRCPGCGFERPAPEIPKEGEGDLSKLGEVDEVPFAARAAYWDALEERRLQYGYREGWSLYRYQQRFGRWPLIATMQGRRVLVDPFKAGSLTRESVYRELLSKARSNGWKDGWAAYQFKAKFGAWPEWGMQQRVRATAPITTDSTAS